MESILIGLVVVLLVGVIALVILLVKKGKGSQSEAGSIEGMKLIQDQMEKLRETMDKKMGENTKGMNDALHKQFGESQKLIKEITQEITQVKEIGKQSLSVADQLRELQDILKNPKQRGILGEYYLEALLRNVMAPDQYEMQYRFQNGDIVDAVVKVKDKIIPVDSKFSLENYNRFIQEKNPVEQEVLRKIFENDLKERIKETSKYVRPSEGTMEFAFMFIPHEAIYYDLLINKVGVSEESENLIQRAASKYKVIIVSPTSFLAYLQTVLQALHALQIEEKAKDIVKHVGQLNTHLKRYEEYHNKLGTSLHTVVNHYTNSGKEFKKIDKDIFRISGEAAGIEVVAIEGPEREE